jgi:hypothetical protein
MNKKYFSLLSMCLMLTGMTAFAHLKTTSVQVHSTLTISLEMTWEHFKKLDPLQNIRSDNHTGSVSVEVLSE